MTVCSKPGNEFDQVQPENPFSMLGYVAHRPCKDKSDGDVGTDHAGAAV